ncbi:MAG TPA: sugar ABC transporter ATP-binding protein [Bacteroidota bacterium]|nr:sugar ABC transporter ATP-binding protein [Bacteroidota bacterium]
MSSETKPADFVLRMENISKSFPGIVALDSVRLDVAKGEVHVLMGENGAGKSTLMKILSGIYQKDRGAIYLNGKAVEIKSTKEALRLGISMIHQELNPVKAMSVSENIFLGKEPTHGFLGVVNRKKEREMTQALFLDFGISVDPDAVMEDLSVAEMQMVEIARAVSYDSRVIIMDEPTSALADAEVSKLFEIIRRLVAAGIAVIYISHKMDEIFQIADTITVLRDGQFIESRAAKMFDQDTLVKLMVGRSVGELFPEVRSQKGPVTLEVERLTLGGVFHDVSFKARKGEVLGFAGLMGAGRSEIMETIFGLRKADAGTISVNGKAAQIRSPQDAIAHRLAFITDDRQSTGLNMKVSVKDNITLVALKTFTSFTQVLRPEQENRAVDEEIGVLQIKSRHRDQIVNTLSGGNQQKVVLAKWLLSEPEIIILDEPTRGIDIGAKAEVYKIVARLAEQGRTILFISSELQEVMGMCDRIIVIHRGSISGEFERAEFDREKIVNAAMDNGDYSARRN